MQSNGMGHALVAVWNKCRVMEWMMPGMPSRMSAE